MVLLNSGVDIPGSWIMMQEITRIISPNHPWPNLPKKQLEIPGGISADVRVGMR